MSKKAARILGSICLILFSTMVTADVINVSPSAFQAEDGSADFAIASGGWGDYVYRVTGASERYAVAPVDIPHSVLIRYMRVHYMDNDPSNGLFAGITRVNKYTGTHNVIYSFFSAGASTSITFGTDFNASPSPSYALTNLEACSYQCTIATDAIGSSMLKVYGFTIVYDPWP